MYKTAEGKGQNVFGLGERVMDAPYAAAVVITAHVLL